VTLGIFFMVPDAAMADVPAAPRVPADSIPRAVEVGGQTNGPTERTSG
jgi:hypothetical protein